MQKFVISTAALGRQIVPDRFDTAYADVNCPTDS